MPTFRGVGLPPTPPSRLVLLRQTSVFLPQVARNQRRRCCHVATSPTQCIASIDSSAPSSPSPSPPSPPSAPNPPTLPPPPPSSQAHAHAHAPHIFAPNPYDGAIFSLALPAILALAADPLLQIVDTIFIGQTGSDALAALGVNSAIFTFTFVVFNFLATATTPLVATALAQGHASKAGTTTVQALALATVLGTLVTLGLTLGADQALALMGADPTSTPHMFALAKEFLLIRAYAAPAVLLMTVGQGVFRGLRDMRTPMTITLTANAINLALDVVLILGLHWSVQGAATATTVAEWVAALAYLSLLYGRRQELGGRAVVTQALGSVQAMRASLADMAPFLSAGGAVLMRTALLLGTKTLASATATHLGPVPIASHQVVMQLWLLSSLVIDSVAVAGQTLVAVEKGRNDVPVARAVSNRLLQLGVGGGLVLGALFWAAEPTIPFIFTQDAAVAASVTSILPIAVAMLPINAAVYVLDGVLVGASDFKWMAGAMVVAAAAAVGLLFSVEPMELGLVGVWGALATLMTGRLATLVWRYQDPQGPLPPSVGSSAGTGGSINKEGEACCHCGNGGTSPATSTAVVLTNVRPVKPPMSRKRVKSARVKGIAGNTRYRATLPSPR